MSDPESEYEKRYGYAPNRILGEIERDHKMNGTECPGTWKVLQFPHGGLAFYCEECNVGHHGGAAFEELKEIWES